MAVLVAEVYFLEKVENIKDTISLVLFLYPNVAKAGGLQSQGVNRPLAYICQVVNATLGFRWESDPVPTPVRDLLLLYSFQPSSQ